MRTYLISYDLAAPSEKKHELAETIMGLGLRWARPLEQTWYVTTKRKLREIQACLADHLDDNDGLIVQAVEDKATLTNTALRWFRQRPTTYVDDLAEALSEAANVVAFQSNDDAPAYDTEEIEYAEAS